MADHNEDKSQKRPLEKATYDNTRSLLHTIMVSLIVSLVVVGLGLKGYDARYATKIVVIDMKPYMQDLQKQMAKGQIDKTGLRAALEKLDLKLQSLPANQVIILKDVVVGNVEEIKP